MKSKIFKGVFVIAVIAVIVICGIGSNCFKNKNVKTWFKTEIKNSIENGGNSGTGSEGNQGNNESNTGNTGNTGNNSGGNTPTNPGDSSQTKPGEPSNPSDPDEPNGELSITAHNFIYCVNLLLNAQSEGSISEAINKADNAQSKLTDKDKAMPQVKVAISVYQGFSANYQKGAIAEQLRSQYIQQMTDAGIFEEILPEVTSYINEINAVLDALNTVCYESNLSSGMILKYSNLSERDKERDEVQAARTADTLIRENLIYDGYWWAPLDIRQRATEIMINAGLRAEAGELKEIPHPSTTVPFTPEAQEYIDAVNAALDAKDIKQYHLLGIKMNAGKLSESDLNRSAVKAAREAGTLILEKSTLSNGVWNLPLDVRLQAAKIMKAAGLRTNLSWVE